LPGEAANSECIENSDERQGVHAQGKLMLSLLCSVNFTTPSAEAAATPP
jgi:hypothetical protein